MSRVKRRIDMRIVRFWRSTYDVETCSMSGLPMHRAHLDPDALRAGCSGPRRRRLADTASRASRSRCSHGPNASATAVDVRLVAVGRELHARRDAGREVGHELVGAARRHACPRGSRQSASCPRRARSTSTRSRSRMPPSSGGRSCPSHRRTTRSRRTGGACSEGRARSRRGTRGTPAQVQPVASGPCPSPRRSCGTSRGCCSPRRGGARSGCERRGSRLS